MKTDGRHGKMIQVLNTFNFGVVGVDRIVI